MCRRPETTAAPLFPPLLVLPRANKFLFFRGQIGLQGGSIAMVTSNSNRTRKLIPEWKPF